MAGGAAGGLAGASAGGGEAADASDGGAAGQLDLFALDIAALGARLHEELAFRDKLEELPETVVYTLLGIEPESVAALKCLFSSGATAEEVILLEASNTEAVDVLRKTLETRREEQMKLYASYAPNEVNYLREAVLEVKGLSLFYCVSADSQAAKEWIAAVFADQ